MRQSATSVLKMRMRTTHGKPHETLSARVHGNGEGGGPSFHRTIPICTISRDGRGDGFALPPDLSSGEQCR